MTNWLIWEKLCYVLKYTAQYGTLNVKTHQAYWRWLLTWVEWSSVDWRSKTEGRKYILSQIITQVSFLITLMNKLWWQLKRNAEECVYLSSHTWSLYLGLCSIIIHGWCRPAQPFIYILSSLSSEMLLSSCHIFTLPL